MKYLKYIPVFLLCMAFAYPKDTDCKKLFTGKWKYKNIDPKNLFVVRTLQKQREYVDSGKHFYEFKIHWIDKCSYHLIYVGTTSAHPASIKAGDSLLVEILNIDKTKMTYRTTVSNGAQDNDEMEKMR
ncbi:hypothetical protein [Ferruginibacter sp. SUN106]|uniref:hypothetical protein n=1 Tax=Ferruginibacter sp. SUN106 TaxID=2978348 RepID=UPI003D36C4C3